MTNKSIEGSAELWVGLDDKKRQPSFTMRFTELEVAQLKHIAETTPDSMHLFCIKAVRKALDEKFA